MEMCIHSFENEMPIHVECSPHSISLPSSSTCTPSPQLSLSPKDFAPFRELRQRDNINYSDKKRRIKKNTRPKKSMKNRIPKVIDTCVDTGLWRTNGHPVTDRVYIHNDRGTQIRPTYPSVTRYIDGMIIREGDDIQSWTDDDHGNQTLGVARVTNIYIPPRGKCIRLALLWYYLPSQIESSQTLDILPMEIFASRHLDWVPIEAFENKVKVMTKSQYSTHMGALKRCSTYPFSQIENAPVPADNFFFTRGFYDFSKKKVIYFN